MCDKTMQKVCRMIEKECSRNSLVDLLEYNDLTENDWYTFINRGLGCENNGYVEENPKPLTLEELKAREVSNGQK